MRAMTREEILNLSREDVMNMVSTFDFRSHDLVNAVAKIVGLRLTTQYYSLNRDYWVCTQPDNPDFSGTFVEISTFVRGYACAWVSGQRKARRLLEQFERDIQTKLKDEYL